MIAEISLAPKGVLTVNEIITKGALPTDFSRTTIVQDWFRAVTASEKAYWANRKVAGSAISPLTAFKTNVEHDGQRYNVYNCNGIAVLYRYNAQDTQMKEDGTPLGHTFLMYTDDATRVHVPIVKEKAFILTAGTRLVMPTNVAVTPAVETTEDVLDI